MANGRFRYTFGYRRNDVHRNIIFLTFLFYFVIFLYSFRDKLHTKYKSSSKAKATRRSQQQQKTNSDYTEDVPSHRTKKRRLSDVEDIRETIVTDESMPYLLYPSNVEEQGYRRVNRFMGEQNRLALNEYNRQLYHYSNRQMI